MKIGEVAKRTGLTEKAIRVYVDNGLVSPIVEQTTHRNSYDFTEAAIGKSFKIKDRFSCCIVLCNIMTDIRTLVNINIIEICIAFKGFIT